MDTVVIAAEVKAIDSQERTLTLMHEDGKLVTMQVGDHVRRFEEIQVGDVVKAEYSTYILSEFRDPTPEEYLEPLVFVEGAEIATDDLLPGVAVGTAVKAVVEVAAKDLDAKLVTLKGPRGS